MLGKKHKVFDIENLLMFQVHFHDEDVNILMYEGPLKAASGHAELPECIGNPF